jgi:hypothetical protein
MTESEISVLDHHSDVITLVVLALLVSSVAFFLKFSRFFFLRHNFLILSTLNQRAFGWWEYSMEVNGVEY